jgi:plasmid stabilization system protein ParE
MPSLIFSQDSIIDLQRVKEFLATKNAAASDRAKLKILADLKALPHFPEAHRPVIGLAHQRELVIKFGSYGYIARYHYERGGDVVILRIWHQREDTSS